MTILVIGGSGSGKSAYAEGRLAAFQNVQTKYYLATMQVFDEEGREKVERHKMQRRGKGFLTLEQPKNIGEAAWKIKAAAEKTGETETAVLLECISNLVANEMFDGWSDDSGEKDAAATEERTPGACRERDESAGEATPVICQKRDKAAGKSNEAAEEVTNRIMDGIRRLQAGTTHLVIVTNNVFEDGISYEVETMEYIRVLAAVNRELAKLADEVNEVVVGLPVLLKKGSGAL